jgi:hypothetical protein
MTAARKERAPAMEQAQVLRDLLLERGFIVNEKDLRAFPKGYMLRGMVVLKQPVVWLLARRPPYFTEGQMALADVMIESLTGKIRVTPYARLRTQDDDFAKELRDVIRKSGLGKWLRR